MRLTVTEQDLFGLFNKQAVYPVPNKWGQQGWTTIEMQTVPAEFIEDAIQAAYRGRTQKSLA